MIFFITWTIFSVFKYCHEPNCPILNKKEKNIKCGYDIFHRVSIYFVDI